MDPAIELAKQRWALLNDFDLEDEQWERLFSMYTPGEILTAIKYLSRVRSSVPATRYQLFEKELQRIASKQIFQQIFS
jgi:hypothetical protein